jgi:hypothetical protein
VGVKTEDRRQKTEDRSKKQEARSKKQEDSPLLIAFFLLLTFVSYDSCLLLLTNVSGPF